MTRQTIASIKSEIVEIANQIGKPELMNVTGHKGRRETWLVALNQAHAALIQHLAVQQEQQRLAEEAAAQIETELVSSEEPLTTANDFDTFEEDSTYNVRYTEEDNMEILNKAALAVNLANELVANGGFSLWFDGEQKQSGFSVGNNTYSYKVPNIKVESDGVPLYTWAVVIDAIQTFFSHVEKLNNENIYVCDGVGGWLDTEEGVLYIDPIRHYQFLGDALDVALDNKELAIYDLGAKECYNVYEKDSEKVNNSYDLWVKEYPAFTPTDNHIWYMVYNPDTYGIVDGYIADFTF